VGEDPKGGWTSFLSEQPAEPPAPAPFSEQPAPAPKGVPGAPAVKR